MANVFITSDLHEGHANIGKFRRIPQRFIDEADGDYCVANSLWLDYYWKALVRKQDVVQALGDNAFTGWGLAQIRGRPGRKFMKGGNHDDLQASKYLEVFEDFRGCEKKYGVWLTHIPIHTDELRGKFNVHGHTHYHEIDDYRYINVCCDNLFDKIGKPFLTLLELRQVIENRKSTEEVVWL